MRITTVQDKQNDNDITQVSKKSKAILRKEYILDLMETDEMSRADSTMIIDDMYFFSSHELS